jgi:hypothetical protein
MTDNNPAPTNLLVPLIPDFLRLFEAGGLKQGPCPNDVGWSGLADETCGFGNGTLP